MLSKPGRPEIDHRTIKLIVGIIAISLPFLARYLTGHAITSISAVSYEVGPPQQVFVGFLFAIAAFLLAYNGRSTPEMVLSKVASFAGLGVALFPCQCDIPPEVMNVPPTHAISAVVMFLILAFFCYEFLRRALEKGHTEAKVRAFIYFACAIVIVLSIVVLALDAILKHAIKERVPYLTFYGEGAGLLAFGVSWLTASRTLPGVTRKNERFSPLRASNPD